MSATRANVMRSNRAQARGALALGGRMVTVLATFWAAHYIVAAILNNLAQRAKSRRQAGRG